MIRKSNAAMTKALLVAIKAKSSAGVFAIATDLMIIFFIVTSPPFFGPSL